VSVYVIFVASDKSPPNSELLRPLLQLLISQTMIRCKKYWAFRCYTDPVGSIHYFVLIALIGPRPREAYKMAFYTHYQYPFQRILPSDRTWRNEALSTEPHALRHAFSVLHWSHGCSATLLDRGLIAEWHVVQTAAHGLSYNQTSECAGCLNFMGARLGVVFLV
jgi:hypothetical protein